MALLFCVCVSVWVSFIFAVYVYEFFVSLLLFVWMFVTLGPLFTIAVYVCKLTLVLLNPDIPNPAFANSVDPDQLASGEAN